MGADYYRLGLALLILAAVTGIVGLVIQTIKANRLKKTLEKEYGPKRH